MRDNKLKELEGIIKLITGMSLEEVAKLPHDEQIHRIDVHTQPRDIFKEAVEEMLTDRRATKGR